MNKLAVNKLAVNKLAVNKLAVNKLAVNKISEFDFTAEGTEGRGENGTNIISFRTDRDLRSSPATQFPDFDFTAEGRRGRREEEQAHPIDS